MILKSVKGLIIDHKRKDKADMPKLQYSQVDSSEPREVHNVVELFVSSRVP